MPRPPPPPRIRYCSLSEYMSPWAVGRGSCTPIIRSIGYMTCMIGNFPSYMSYCIQVLSGTVTDERLRLYTLIQNVPGSEALTEQPVPFSKALCTSTSTVDSRSKVTLGSNHWARHFAHNMRWSHF